MDQTAIQKAMSAGGFLARHALALGVLVAVPCALWTVAYICLFVFAMFTDGDIGGLLLYPAGLVMVFTGMLGVGLGVFFPITAVAEWVGYHRGWPRTVQFSAGIALLLVLPVIAGLCMAVHKDATWYTFPTMMGISFAVLVAPFTIYWGVTQSLPVTWAVIRWVWSFFKGKDGQPPFADYPRRPSEDGTRSCKALR